MVADACLGQNVLRACLAGCKDWLARRRSLVQQLETSVNSVYGQLIWQKGLLIDATKLTVAQHLHNWLDGKSDLCPLSRQGYVHIIERQIIPTLGAIELQKLKVADVKAWLTAVRVVGNVAPALSGTPIAYSMPP